MNNRLFIGVLLLVFAIALAIVLGLQLTGQAAAIAFGAAIGVIVGVPAGLGSAYLAHRWGWFPQVPSQAVTTVQQIEGLTLTTEQSEVLYAVLQRIDALNAAPMMPSAPQPAAAGPVLTRPLARSRDISVVGGADLTQSLDDQASE